MAVTGRYKRLQIRRKRGVRLGRSIFLAALVGVVAGLGAVVFHLLCQLVTHVGLASIAQYQQGGPHNEIEVGLRHLVGPSDAPAEEPPPPIPWLLIVVPTVGGIVSGFLVYRFAPEAEGHGTDAAIDAYHNGRGVIRSRVPIVKMFSSAITLGTGGSGGREGPIAQIGAGFGSYLATRLHLSDTERRALLAAGIGAGIGAIFHAPLAGAIFACEVLYRDPEFEAENLIPAFIATTVSFSVFSLCFGADAFKPLFEVAPGLSFTRPFSLLMPLVVLAVAMAAASWLYTRTLYGMQGLFQRLQMPRFLRPAVGAALTGLVAVALYLAMGRLDFGAEAQRDTLSVLSFGYGFLQKILSEELFGESLFLVVALLLAVGFGKILTTSLTIGSGGSGGVFGPSMVIGGALGGLIGVLFHQVMPEVVHQTDIVVFAILGMASFFAAAANTPVSTLIMVSEMCSSYVLLLPSMWVCALSYLLSRGWSLYQNQVNNRRDSAAHRGDFVVDVLQGLTVRDAIGHGQANFVTVPLGMPLRDMSRLLTDTRQSCFPVVDDEGLYVGLFSLNDIRQFLYDDPVGELAVAEDLADTSGRPLLSHMNLSAAIGRFAEEGFEELPVVDDHKVRRVVGILRRQDLIATYSSRLLAMRGGR